LRAIGLSSGQMIAFLAAELALLIVTGGAIGTGLGVWISDLFIPYLQIGGPDASALIPPYLVTMAWPTIFRVYVLFGLLFVGALAGLVLLLRRLRIFQAIKMGESL
jgi:putative ABC transport system permease protein